MSRNKESQQVGVILEAHPQPWAIIQQRFGKADIQLAGRWQLAEENVALVEAVFVRVVKEDDGTIVLPWTTAELLENAQWRCMLRDVPAGGLYRLETALRTKDMGDTDRAVRGDMVHHIGVGDLWVIAGQSNAAGYGEGPIADPPEIGVHLFRNSNRWDLASHPFNESTDTVHPVNRERGNPGHSPYLAFAKRIKQATGRPVGLLQTSLGGSPLSAWRPEEEGRLYRNMMSVIEAAGGSVRGVLWYQGEADAGNRRLADTYQTRFASFVETVRRNLQNPDVAFLTVQLNRRTQPVASIDQNRNWGIVREAQRQSARQTPGVFAVPATDCGLSDKVHNNPAGNLLIGERLARTALVYVYNMGGSYRAPDLVAARLHAGNGSDAAPAIKLQFENVSDYLSSIGNFASHSFTVEDEEGFIGVKGWAFKGRDAVVLSLDREPMGEAVVHGLWEQNPEPCPLADVGTYMPPLSFYRISVERA